MRDWYRRERFQATVERGAGHTPRLAEGRSGGGAAALRERFDLGIVQRAVAQLATDSKLKQLVSQMMLWDVDEEK